MISQMKRDVLIAHIDGPVQFVVGDSHRLRTTKALIHRGWLRTDRAFRPKHTFITEHGREILAEALADWADALVEAGFQREKMAFSSPLSVAAK